MLFDSSFEHENWSIKISELHADFVERKVYGKSHEDRDLTVLVIKDAQGRDNVPQVNPL